MPSKRKAVRESDELVQAVCTQCNIAYSRHSYDPQLCPLCETYRELRAALKRLGAYEQEVSRLRDENERLKANTDFVVAVQRAADLLGVEDLAFLKAVLYRWRDCKNVTLRTKDGSLGPNTLQALWRTGPPDERTMTSVGGVAICGIVAELNHAYGGNTAVMTLARAMSDHLKGGL